MQIGIPRESLQGENRVAASPKSVQQLKKLGFEILIESKAGEKASFNDASFQDAGATIGSATEVWQSDIILKINAPSSAEIKSLNSDSTCISLLAPAQNDSLLQELSHQKVTALSVDSIPRISRAQSMDVLSSMANIAGYRAVVEASANFGRFFTGQITAAGKIPPAKVMIIGAGVAGLAAIGTAGSLGAIVRAFDTRPEVKEQIESMGAEFLELDFEEEAGSGDGYAKVMSDEFIKAEMALFAEQAKDVDIIITTAMIPGKPAPKLITREMVQSMKPGSVIVDLAAGGGGNCELTVPGEISVSNEVKIIGYTDLPSRLPTQSSQLYSNNLVNLMKLLCPNKDGQIHLDFEDPIMRNITVVKSGEITFPPPPIQVSAAPKSTVETQPPVQKESEKQSGPLRKNIFMLVAALLFGYLAKVAPTEFLSHFTVFILAIVVGYHVVWNVSHSLHTPLMSVTNAISGIVIIGALIQVGTTHQVAMILAGVAILIASINIFGGFLVTLRMLKMFKKEG